MIAHSRPSLQQEDIDAVTEVLRSGQLVQGPYVDRFERAVAAMVGVKGGVAVHSGTAALELALRTLGVGSGDEVIMPSYVCAALWLAAQRVGALPRLVDIELDTYALDPVAARQAVSSKTRAIIIPHAFGLPADCAALEPLGIPMIEDCAQTLGATIRGQQVGTMGKVAVCSFYATKLLCTGEGGMLLSDDDGILEQARALRGYDQEPTVDPASFNRKLTDMQAALGLSQLARFPAFLARRAEIAEHYRNEFAPLDVVLPPVPEERTHVYFRFVIRVPQSRRGPAAVNELLRNLEHRGVQCRRPVFRALHRYLELEGFPRSDEASETALSVPIYPTMSDDEIAKTAEVVRRELM